MVSKLSSKEATNREKLAKAIAGLEDGTYKTSYEAAKDTGASRRTLDRRLKGGLTRQQARELDQALSTDEERALAHWIRQLSATGHPVTHPFLCELAEEIRKPRVDSENNFVTPLGQDWTKRFMRRNPQLKTVMASGIEVARKEVTQESLNQWFNKFKRVVQEYDISQENIYNMDETGF